MKNFEKIGSVIITIKNPSGLCTINNKIDQNIIFACLDKNVGWIYMYKDDLTDTSIMIIIDNFFR